MREGKNKNIYKYRLVMFKFLLLMKEEIVSENSFQN